MIIPSTLAYLYSAAAGGAPTCSDFPPSEPSSFYGPPAPYNTQDLNTWGFQDQLPPTVAPSSEHPLFPDEGPPSYQSLWPPYNTCDALGQTKKITSNKNTSFWWLFGPQLTQLTHMSSWIISTTYLQKKSYCGSPSCDIPYLYLFSRLRGWKDFSCVICLEANSCRLL